MALSFINHLRIEYRMDRKPFHTYISYLYFTQIWNMVPEEMKQKSSVFAFTRKIKQWVPENCPCRTCKNYLPSIWFI